MSPPDPIVEEVKIFLSTRSEVGFKKHNAYLTREDLSPVEWLVNLMEELGDGLNYAQRLRHDLEDPGHLLQEIEMLKADGKRVRALNSDLLGILSGLLDGAENTTTESGRPAIIAAIKPIKSVLDAYKRAQLAAINATAAPNASG